jgi:hypothetical protein
MLTPSATASNNPNASKTLGLITFDLDDTLYPLLPSLKKRIARLLVPWKVSGFGDNIRPQDMSIPARRFEKEIAATDPDRAHGCAHACKFDNSRFDGMERITLTRKLKLVPTIGRRPSSQSHCRATRQSTLLSLSFLYYRYRIIV